ncbi:MAG TPA: PAS domain S-box protein [Gemmatimonadales bacterium]|nr:PAS domain S-box protein [Gemmatimonadales bacterium]
MTSPDAETLDSAWPRDEELCTILIARVRDYAIFALSPTGKIMTWNEGARLIKGYSADEIIGKSMETFYTPEDLQRGKPGRLLRQAATNGRVEDEGWRVRKDGSRFWADVVITALRDGEGGLTGFAKITRDLTERRKAEQAIGELSGRLFRLQDEERKRLARALHDRTSPYLSAVLSSLFKVREHLEEEDHELLGDVIESIDKVQATSDVISRVSHMLHPARLEQGGLVETLRWYVNAVSGQLGFAIDAELPDQPIRVSAEGQIVLFRLIQECLSQLMGHAGPREATIRLLPNGAVKLEIAIHGALQPRMRDDIALGNGDFGVAFAGVRERLRQLGGTLKITMGGTKSLIEATLPLAE